MNQTLYPVQLFCNQDTLADPLHPLLGIMANERASRLHATRWESDVRLAATLASLPLPTDARVLFLRCGVCHAHLPVLLQLLAGVFNGDYRDLAALQLPK